MFSINNKWSAYWEVAEVNGLRLRDAVKSIVLLSFSEEEKNETYNYKNIDFYISNLIDFKKSNYLAVWL